MQEANFIFTSYIKSSTVFTRPNFIAKVAKIPVDYYHFFLHIILRPNTNC